ncbi:hypothetical protein LTR62_001377 [Meristemomyces frigidus]|uniref:PIG-P domain-containing protein n=1 Tax=Meristemomyces frigidus TaxID=1508187 RepID=A0AAN7YME4_9PEZI|nr:hypothetical protein LTR62_001377 [Meristemomyces frigidus]
MPPQSRGDRPAKPLPLPLPAGFQSKSTPNLPTLRSLKAADGRSSTTAEDVSAALHPGTTTDGALSPIDGRSIDEISVTSSVQPSSLSPTSSDNEEASEEEENGHLPSLPIKRPLRHHQYSRSYTYLAPSNFAPPFYNRPRTPLPPSPSLTSLLRPNFTSRPTTPDPSSDEGGISSLREGETTGIHTGTQTPNSAAASTLTSTFRSAKPVPRASPKVPTYEYYGFTLYLTSSLCFIAYILWSFLPSPFLHQLGIYYYPNRWWALAVPAWTVMLLVYIYVALASYNTGYLTKALESVECFVDEAANIAVVDEGGNIVRDERPSWVGEERGGVGAGAGAGKRGKGRYAGHSRQTSRMKGRVGEELDWRTLWNEGTDAVMDIPLGGVCEILYGQYD